MKRIRMLSAVPLLAALLAAAGCSTIPNEITTEQVRSNLLVATAADAVAANMRAEYVDPATAADAATINAALNKDAAAKYGAVSVAEYNDWLIAARAKADEAIARKIAQRNAPLEQLEAISAQAKSNAGIADALAKKVNGEK